MSTPTTGPAEPAVPRVRFVGPAVASQRDLRRDVIVGLEWPIKRWALERGWNDRKTDQREARGVPIGGLGTPQKFYRL